MLDEELAEARLPLRKQGLRDHAREVDAVGFGHFIQDRDGSAVPEEDPFRVYCYRVSHSCSTPGGSEEKGRKG